jgi:hypothetical protein
MLGAFLEWLPELAQEHDGAIGEMGKPARTGIPGKPRMPTSGAGAEGGRIFTPRLPCLDNSLTTLGYATMVQRSLALWGTSIGN